MRQYFWQWLVSRWHDDERQWRQQRHRQRHFANRRRRLRLLETSGNVHRAGAVRVYILRRSRRQWVPGDDICSAQAHDQRAQYLHTEPGTGRPFGPIEQHTVHVHYLRGTPTLQWFFFLNLFKLRKTIPFLLQFSISFQLFGIFCPRLAITQTRTHTHTNSSSHIILNRLLPFSFSSYTHKSSLITPLSRLPQFILVVPSTTRPLFPDSKS